MKRILFYVAPLCLALPALASAYEGYVVSDISLQAGPDTEYPSITELPAGTPVDIRGCIDGYTWCDVVVGEDRGWVAGSFIEDEYENQPVVIEDYGPRFRIPIVTFTLGTYWGSHYHNRPWFNERSRWEERHIRPHQPPRPSIEVIRNAPRVHAGNMGNRDHNRPVPSAAPVATPAPAATPAGMPQARPQTPAKQATPRAEMEHQRPQPRPTPSPAPAVQPTPHPVAGPKPAPPNPVAEPRQMERKPPIHAPAPPQQKAEPKPKREPEKDDGHKKDDNGHKDDSKDH